MNIVYKNLNYVQTPIIICGDPFNDSENVIICITGNPGIAEFYIDFASELYNKTNLPVCVIGHAGHEESLLSKDKCLFSLQDQLEHKLDLIENHINKNSKIHLIGHSIGAWMIIELLQKHSPIIKKISSINLLFPTIQKMAESRNGKFVNNILRSVYRILLFLSGLLYLLPRNILSYIIGIYLWVNSLPSNFNTAILKILNPDALQNIFHLAFEEMDTVLSMNTEGIQTIKHLTNIVYGTNDGWVPLEYIESLKQFKPDLKLIEAHNVQHAFVMKSSEHIASIVADFINTKIVCL